MLPRLALCCPNMHAVLYPRCCEVQSPPLSSPPPQCYHCSSSLTLVLPPASMPVRASQRSKRPASAATVSSKASATPTNATNTAHMPKSSEALQQEGEAELEEAEAHLVADALRFRASCLSTLAETCRVLGRWVQPVAHDVITAYVCVCACSHLYC